jgi:hypothetical protein
MPPLNILLIRVLARKLSVSRMKERIFPHPLVSWRKLRFGKFIV